MQPSYHSHEVPSSSFPAPGYLSLTTHHCMLVGRGLSCTEPVLRKRVCSFAFPHSIRFFSSVGTLFAVEIHERSIVQTSLPLTSRPRRRLPSSGSRVCLFIIVRLIMKFKLSQFIFIFIRISIKSESSFPLAMTNLFLWILLFLFVDSIFIQSECVIKLCQLRLGDKITGGQHRIDQLTAWTSLRIPFVLCDKFNRYCAVYEMLSHVLFITTHRLIVRHWCTR